MSARDDIPALLRATPVDFATTSSPGGTGTPAQRRVVVAGPQAVLDLIATPTLDLLDALIAALGDAATAWAAEILLAALTGREAEIVDAFARMPDAWVATQREAALAAWSAWLARERDRLEWSGREGRFVRSAP
ncbi:MAG TPA: hypothetical protein VKB52_11585 [Rhodanobacteraceae bacterium]|nr:hypothetical protein [Rhodanobacteraceae bacterium]